MARKLNSFLKHFDYVALSKLICSTGEQTMRDMPQNEGDRTRHEYYVWRAAVALEFKVLNGPNEDTGPEGWDINDIVDWQRIMIKRRYHKDSAGTALVDVTWIHTEKADNYFDSQLKNLLALQGQELPRKLTPNEPRTPEVVELQIISPREVIGPLYKAGYPPGKPDAFVNRDGTKRIGAEAAQALRRQGSGKGFANSDIERFWYPGYGNLSGKQMEGYLRQYSLPFIEDHDQFLLVAATWITYLDIPVIEWNQ